MSAKSLKFFGPPTTKWQPCKIFAKLNGNHYLMANIFKLHKYWTFGLMKMHMCKMQYVQNLICQKHIQFMKIFGLRLTGRWKGYLLIFAFSFFRNFK